MSATSLRRTLIALALAFLTGTAVFAAPAAPARPTAPLIERLEEAARRWIAERLGPIRGDVAPKCGGGIDPNGCPKPCTSNCG